MSRILLVINGAVLLGCAVFSSEWLSANSQSTLLTLLLLFLPFTDRQWFATSLKINKAHWLLYGVIVCCSALVVIYKPDSINFMLSTLLLTALPEEWFFRAYFMSRLQEVLKNFIYYKWKANVLTSLMFALLHMPGQGWFGLSIVLPSLFFGWLYQKYNDIVLVIGMHMLFNLMFFVFMRNIVDRWL